MLTCVCVCGPRVCVCMCVQVRYGQLGKQQERLLRDMEAVVARRETMVMRSEAQAQIGRASCRERV